MPCLLRPKLGKKTRLNPVSKAHGQAVGRLGRQLFSLLEFASTLLDPSFPRRLCRCDFTFLLGDGSPYTIHLGQYLAQRFFSHIRGYSVNALLESRFKPVGFGQMTNSVSGNLSGGISSRVFKRPGSFWRILEGPFRLCYPTAALLVDGSPCSI